MEARRVAAIPEGPEWTYEPKWDGFRCLAFRDGANIELQSKAAKPLTRYFPEIAEALLAVKARQFVIDGELVVPIAGGLSFDDLLQRIHPAASRIAKLSKERPAQYIVFDYLVDAKRAALLTDLPFEDRRARLEAFYASVLKAARASIKLSQSTRDRATAQDWLKTLRGRLDGIVAKRLDGPYASGERAMIKVKNLRTADCVVGGFRYAESGSVAGSLLLGLYEGNVLHHVGFTSSMPMAQREALTRKLEKLIHAPGFTGRAPGGPSRWSTERSAEWQPLKPVLVVEVEFDHFTGGRFRHGTKFLRWRSDKAPLQCSIQQVQYESKVPITDLLLSA
jgi:ATP-dependent DNA ligase